MNLLPDSDKPVKPGTIVCKFSGKPFKSGRKTATVKGVVSRLLPSAPRNGMRVLVEKPGYIFSDEEEGYVVDVRNCKAMTTEVIEG